MMKHSYLTTHWTPEEAHTILSLLDQLRDLIWQSYESEIAKYCQALQQAEGGEDDFFDPIPF